MEEVNEDEQLLKLRDEVNFWKDEVRRVNLNWEKVWREFQERFNEKCVEAQTLAMLVTKLAKPDNEKELKYG